MSVVCCRGDSIGHTLVEALQKHLVEVDPARLAAAGPLQVKPDPPPRRKVGTDRPDLLAVEPDLDAIPLDPGGKGVPPPLAVEIRFEVCQGQALTGQRAKDWRGEYDRPRAERWIAERDAEGTVLLATEAGSPVGLLLLYEEPDPTGGAVLRLGYVIAGSASGRGLASELLGGLVGWGRERPNVRALVGGVEAGNAPSIRVLEKCGFTPTVAAAAPDSLEYRLEL